MKHGKVTFDSGVIESVEYRKNTTQFDVSDSIVFKLSSESKNHVAVFLEENRPEHFINIRSILSIYLVIMIMGKSAHVPFLTKMLTNPYKKT